MKPTIITSQAYRRPADVKGLRGLLKYLEFREGSLRRELYLRDGRYPEGLIDPPAKGQPGERWMDHGMGSGYRQIIDSAHRLRGRSVLARTWVLSPDPELMAHVPEEQRVALVGRLTEATVERWYSDNGWGTPEYSYVVHDKHRASDGQQMVHSHVITPGTVAVDAAEDLGRIDHYVARAHLRDLNHSAEEVLAEELGRVLGRERTQQLLRDRAARLERGRQQKGRGHLPGRMRALADLNALLQMEQAARSRGKNRSQSRRVQAELRAASRLAREERRRRKQSDRVRIQAARQQEQQTELSDERARHHGRVLSITERGQRVLTPAERAEQDQRESDLVAQYYLDLLEERELTPGKERQR